MAHLGKNAKANTAQIKVAPGNVGLGGLHTPRQYRNAMAEHNAKNMVNNFLNTHNANQARKFRPPVNKRNINQGGGCGCK
jgi:hypothetical protein